MCLTPMSSGPDRKSSPDKPAGDEGLFAARGPGALSRLGLLCWPQPTLWRLARQEVLMEADGALSLDGAALLTGWADCGKAAIGADVHVWGLPPLIIVI